MKNNEIKKICLSIICVLLPLVYINVQAATKHGHHNHGGHESSVGSPAKTEEANETINVIMLDSMRYVFDKSLDIYEGDVVRFKVKNEGEMVHEFSIGDSKEQREHSLLMMKNPNMIHNDGNTLSLAPGETGEIVWRFKSGKEIVFACNVPGHFEAGMFQKHQPLSLPRTKILTEHEMHQQHDHEAHKH